MPNYKILDKEFVPLVTVKKILKKKVEPTYEQKMALENASDFSKLSETSAIKLIKELKALDMSKLRDEFIVKIADVVPENKEELLLILSASKISFKDEELTQILDAVKNNLK